MPKPLHLFHVFSNFNLGGLEARACVLMNALDREFRHTITAINGDLGAAQRIDPAVNYEIVPSPPGKGSMIYALRFSRLLRAVKPDLLLTYNWGAFDAVLAASIHRICPVVHTEDGFNPDEATRLKARRVWARRLILNRAAAVVVPSRTLRDIALHTYRLRSDIVRWIPNGIDTSKYQTADRERWRSQWQAKPDDFLIGSVGRLAPEKNLSMLLRAVAACGFPNAKVVLAGAGPCRPELEGLAAELGLAGRVIFPGFIPDPSECYGAFDLFAMSSVTEQMPISLLEAMAAGLPAICTEVGDTTEILGQPGWPATIPTGDLDAYIRGLKALYTDAALRQQLAARNCDRCSSTYSLDGMIARYRDLYRSAAGC